MVPPTTGRLPVDRCRPVWLQPARGSILHAGRTLPGFLYTGATKLRVHVPSAIRSKRPRGRERGGVEGEGGGKEGGRERGGREINGMGGGGLEKVE